MLAVSFFCLIGAAIAGSFILKIKRQDELARKEKEIALKLQEEKRAAKQKEAEAALWAAPLVEINSGNTLLRKNEKAYLMESVEFESKSNGPKTDSAAIKGNLLVTNQRIIFSSEEKSFYVSWENLLSFTHTGNGLSITDGRSTRTFTFGNQTIKWSFAIIFEKVLSTQK